VRAAGAGRHVRISHVRVVHDGLEAPGRGSGQEEIEVSVARRTAVLHAGVIDPGEVAFRPRFLAATGWAQEDVHGQGEILVTRDVAYRTVGTDRREDLEEVILLNVRHDLDVKGNVGLAGTQAVARTGPDWSAFVGEHLEGIVVRVEAD